MVQTLKVAPRALGLVYRTNRALTAWTLVLNLMAGALPALAAWLGKHIVDGVLAASRSGLAADRDAALGWVACELAVTLAIAANRRGLEVTRSLLKAQLGHAVNRMILEKAMTLSLRHFEDPEFYDKLTRSRREASTRPLALAQRTFQLLRSLLSLAAYAGLLWQVSPAAVGLLVAAALPAFFAETRFSGEAFRLFRWRTPETRRQTYLELILCRLDFAKEVAISGVAPRLLARYQAIYDKLYAEDRQLTIRRHLWGLLLGAASTLVLYAVYAGVAWRAMSGALSLGEMTMTLLVFRQAQAALGELLSGVGGLYEDGLYLSTLYELLDEPVRAPGGDAVAGPRPGDGFRLEGVGFTYPGADSPALAGVDLHVSAGTKLAIVGHNGSGKTTLIKLMARLYEPTEGRITLDGLDLTAWDPAALRRRFGVIFQDFCVYQMLAGENIGVGDEATFEDEAAWRRAAGLGMAAPIIEDLPGGYRQQLGRMFDHGRALSGGQWQKVALSRAFVREDADIFVLDEPTASMDAEAEVEIFDHVRRISAGKIALLISHRFSTVRLADRIVVLDGGRVLESGTHAQLMAAAGTYARLFTLQARAFRPEADGGPGAAAPADPEGATADG